MCRAPKSKYNLLTTLKKRAALLKQIRDFFAEQKVLEVETPILGNASIPDPNIHSLTVIPSFLKSSIPLYLQTSPEFYMKRLLAKGSGSIYQLCKVFRDDEIGDRHNPEFTMLEWYRVDWDYHMLMGEVEALCHMLIDMPKAKRITYDKLFQNHLNINPTTITTEALSCYAHEHLPGTKNLTLDKDGWLNLLLSELIEPKLEPNVPLFVYDFPPSQAALAKIANNKGQRFELYYQGLELANGFQELTDATEQRQRFLAENKKRQQQNLPQVTIDEAFLTALENGLPESAGVAIGIDRLMMIALDTRKIRDVVGFRYSDVQELKNILLKPKRKATIKEINDAIVKRASQI